MTAEEENAILWDLARKMAKAHKTYWCPFCAMFIDGRHQPTCPKRRLEELELREKAYSIPLKKGFLA